MIYVILLFLLGIVFALIEKPWRAGKYWPWQREGFKTDLVYWLTGPILDKTLVLGLVVVFLLPVVLYLTRDCDLATFKQAAIDAAITEKHKPATGFGLEIQARFRMVANGYGPLADLPSGGQFIMVVIIADFFGYWTHRWFHISRRAWPFHAIHHSSTYLDWLAAVRQHPIGDAIGKSLMAIPLFMLGAPLTIVASAIPFIGLYALFVHANLNWDLGPLRYVFASPVFHRWHHSMDEQALNKNFAALLPLWDLVFGTFYMPRNKYPDNFGATPTVPPNWSGQMIYPFRQFHQGKRANSPGNPPPAQPD